MTRTLTALLLAATLATPAAAGFSGPVMPDMWFPTDDTPVTRTVGGVNG